MYHIDIFFNANLHTCTYAYQHSRGTCTCKFTLCMARGVALSVRAHVHVHIHRHGHTLVHTRGVICALCTLIACIYTWIWSIPVAPCGLCKYYGLPV